MCQAQAMRYIIIGAGAIGATIGGRLAESGREVVLVTRGAHAEALRADGLQLTTVSGNRTNRLADRYRPGRDVPCPPPPPPLLT
ncbi:hypothetical protein SSAG_06252 [Streptomyces sp. Mg1]|nr:hypothetical protein SSAG_06252 [Streptomyces sp. Mg1]